ncbi:KTSC domain-containing protein [Bacteroidia bacterium]|nr:KTSC domain-containing protein [Bacteroidia bacterium]GHV22544.1 KTSC domain-containing protein [Bacteroidia bacterium]
MKRQAVESSNLASIGYDIQNEILEVEFNHGGIYQYFDVPQDVYDELMNADSHGKYFSANIRNDYEYQKL